MTITYTINVPIEDDEDEDDFRKWLYSQDGKDYIQNEIKSGLKLTYFGSNADLEVDEVRVKETETNKYDTDPRV